MRRSLLKTAVLVAVLVAVAGVVGIAPNASASLRPLDLGVSQQLLKPTHLLHGTAAEEYSLNWAGYVQHAAGGAHVTEVRGRWNVASASIVVPSYSVTWVGVGGDGTSDLIQSGTMSSYIEGYYAWYEMLPDSLIPITSGCVGGDGTCKVTPGDEVQSAIWNNGGDNWHIQIENVGKWVWDKDVSYHSNFASAEWIFEAPTVVVQTVPQHVGVQRFLPNSNSFILDGGPRRSITDGSPTITYISPLGIVNLATPSALTAAGAFNVCTYSQSCAAPG